MSKPRLEKRRLGYALVTDSRTAPFGYVRDGKLRMRSGDDYIEFSPEDLERLARELREASGGRRVFQLHKGEIPVISSGA